MLETVNKFTDVLNTAAILFMFVYATHGMTGLGKIVSVRFQGENLVLSLLPQTPI
jgi:hypothetical protein